MKTRYKIIILVTAMLAIFLFPFLLSADNVLLICKDKLLNSDQCHKYLNEKYSNIPVTSYFLEISDYKEFGMTVENLQVKKLSASTIEDKLVSHMDIDIDTQTIVYKCVALEDASKIFVNIENPTVQDIDNNRCSSFETWSLKGRDELRCEQIGGDYNNPEYEGCVLPDEVCNDSFDFSNSDECNTGRQLCEELGGKIIESLTCRESYRAEHQKLKEPLPCDFRGPSGCEFPE